MNLLLPNVTKDPPAIFWANLAVMAGCYAYFLLLNPSADAASGAGADASLPEPIKFALKALDFGSGRERGVRLCLRGLCIGGSSGEEKREGGWRMGD